MAFKSLNQAMSNMNHTPKSLLNLKHHQKLNQRGRRMSYYH